MIVPSGIVLPGDHPLPVREVASGLYIVEQTHERDLGFFSESPLFAKESATTEEVGADEGCQTQIEPSAR
jgi:hypothetical protein